MTGLRLIDNVRSGSGGVFIDRKVLKQTLEDAHQKRRSNVAVPVWPKESGIATN